MFNVSPGIADLTVGPAFTKPGRGEATREQILDTAIRLFRKGGFDETTMRAVATEAGVALGLAYHYFPGKDALVLAYYERVQKEHRLIVHQQLPRLRGLRNRLDMLLQTKLDILRDDRKLMGALFRYTGHPEHPLSFLGDATTHVRADCMCLGSEILAPEKLPDDLQELLPVALWALQMGLLLYFLYDSSPGQKRTRKLTSGAVALIVRLLTLAKIPLIRPARKAALSLLRDANLLPQYKSR